MVILHKIIFADICTYLKMNKNKNIIRQHFIRTSTILLFPITKDYMTSLKSLLWQFPARLYIHMISTIDKNNIVNRSIVSQQFPITKDYMKTLNRF